MEKKYCDYMDEITADELYEGLLGYGMFANKLPPIFTSEYFFNYCQAFSPKYSDEWQDFVSFSSMRNINIPRSFGIPTPMKYQVLKRLCLVTSFCKSGKGERSGVGLSKGMACFSQPSNLLAYILLLSCVPAVASGRAERFDTKKEAKKYSPLQGLPAGGGCKQIIAARRRLFLCFGIAGHAMSFLSAAQYV